MDPAAPAESGVRLYRASGAGLVEVARLDAVAPPRAAEGVLAAEVDGNHVGGAGLFLALVQGGTVVDLARLVFCGGAPSDANEGPDCYSSDPSSSEEKAPPSRARRDDRAPPPRSRGDDEVSAKLFGALPVCGGLVGLDEGNSWEVEEAGKGENDFHLREEDQDWSSRRPVQSGSSFWRSGNSDSSSEEEELDGEHDGDLKIGEEHSTSDEEELGQELHHELNQPELNLEVDQELGLDNESEEENDFHLREEDQDWSSKRPVQSGSSFWRSGNSDSSSEEEELDGEHDGDLKIGEEHSTSDEEELGQKLHHELNQPELNLEVDQELGLGNESEEENDTSMRINLRLWPSQKHVVIKMFREGKWVLTKDYGLVWLKIEDMLDTFLKVDFGAPFAAILGFRSTTCTMDFECSSPMLKDLLVMIKPSIRNFQILKKVGGQDACLVFKCLFIGSKCALKALTQKDPLISEPREIEIISNLKDTHVMMFYQAWTEPWAYKGPQQEYIFIHLEFCHSTLKHALLYENRHWFPNKWHLFEEIVLSVGRVHEHHVVHRDLKPDNIFFNSELRVLMGDFGDACFGRDEFGLYGGGTPKLGTEGYFAPELNDGGKITEKADIFSLGVILFEIFAMFQTKLERSFVFPNLSKEGPSQNWQGDRELYEMMTALQPNDRPSTGEVLDYIRQHHLDG